MSARFGSFRRPVDLCTFGVCAGKSTIALYGGLRERGQAHFLFLASVASKAGRSRLENGAKSP